MSTSNNWPMMMFLVILLVTVILGLIIAPIALGLTQLGGSDPKQACAAQDPASFTPDSGSDESGGAGPPERFIPIYQAAAAKYRLGPKGPATLAAIHGIESGFGTNLGPSSAGAYGQMQFMPATWVAYGVDANGDGKKDPADPQDAIHAAANYLRASGAPRHWYNALFAYNRADWYVQKVQRTAEGYDIPATGDVGGDGDSDCDPNQTTGIPPSCDQLSGTPRQIINQTVLPIAHQIAFKDVTPESVDAANAAHGPTISGGRSDHQGPPDQAWAADISNGGSPTPEMDKLAKRLANCFGIQWSGSGAVTGTKGGYRIQLIYRSMVGGNHYNHVHIGIAKGG